MRKLIAVLAAVAVCAGAVLAEEKTPAQLSDAVYDIQKGKDSVNQIQTLRVKDDARVGGDLTVVGSFSATVPATSLSGNIASARMTNGLVTAVSNMSTVVTIGGTNYYMFIKP